MIDGGIVRRDISHCCAELKLPRVAVTCGKLEGLAGTEGGAWENDTLTMLRNLDKRSIDKIS